MEVWTPLPATYGRMDVANGTHFTQNFNKKLFCNVIYIT